MRINLTKTATQDWGFTVGLHMQNNTTPRIVVRSVSYLGIAALAGLQVGDMIVSVNGTSYAQISVRMFESMMNSSQLLTLEISRGPNVSNQTPISVPSASAASARASAPSTAEVIELNSDDDDEDDEESDDMFRRHYSYNEDSDEDDDDDDSAEAHNAHVLAMRAAAQRRAAAASVRQQTTSAPPRPPVPYNPGEVIDLMSDDDEPSRPPAPPVRASVSVGGSSMGRTQTVQRAQSSAGPAVSALPVRAISTPAVPPAVPFRQVTAPPPQRTHNTAAAAPVTGTTTSNPGTASKRTLDTSTDSGAPASGFKRRRVSAGGIEIKLEFEPKKFGEANIGDEVVEVHGEDEDTTGANGGVMGSASKAAAAEVMVVAAAGSSSTTGATTSAAAEDDDFEGDFQIVGNTMQVASDMPHQRYACTMHPFRVAPTSKSYPYHTQPENAMQLAERGKINIKHCAKCYCYVCDSIVADCGEWNEHCHATHKEPKWKAEKDARNSKILNLMTAQNRSAFFARYRAALAGTRGTAAPKPSSFWDSDDEDGSDYGYLPGPSSAAAGGAYAASLDPNDLSNTSNLVNLICAKLVKCKKDRSGLKSAASSSSSLSSAKSSTPASNKEIFLEASELLLRSIVSPKHGNESPGVVAKAFVAWLMHPLCTLQVREIIRNELNNAITRTAVYAGGVMHSLRELVSLDEATLNRLRSPPATGLAGNVMPPLLQQLHEQVLNVLISELLGVGHFEFIRQLVQTKPNLVPTLFLHHLRTGTVASCQEATALIQQYTSSRPFSTLKGNLMEVEPDKLFRFLAAVISHNIRACSMRGATATTASAALPDNVADTLFNLLLSRIYDAISTAHVAVITSSVDTYMARSSQEGVYRIEEILTWIEAESASKQFFSPLVVYLMIKYCNWRVQNGNSLGTNSGFSAVATLLVTPAAFCNLKLAAYVVLANSFNKHFAPPPLSVDATGVQANVLMACHVALRAATVMKNASMLAEFDPAIREAWMSLPEVRKAKVGEICVAATNQRSPTCGDMFGYRNDCLEMKFCQVVSASGVRSIHPSNSTARSSSQPSSSAVPSVGTSRRVAIYCDVHFSYDTFLMSLVAPKNAFEIKTALACLGHQLTGVDLSSFAQYLEDPSFTVRGDQNLASYIVYLVAHREVLLIIWKGVLIQMYAYMHALYNMDTSSMIGVLAQLARVLKPWLGHLDPVSVNQFSSAPACSGYSQSQLIDLVALDVTLRMAYSFAKLFVKVQSNNGAFSVADLRNFKSSIVIHESANTQQALASKLCQMYLLEYPTVSVRAIWHSFWRRYLLSFVGKRTVSAYCSEAVALETQSVSLLLEDWKQVHEVLLKVATKPQVVPTLITALTNLQRSDLESMNYGGVSGSGELKRALEKLLTLPEPPLALISEKCVEQPDSALASLVLQLNPTVLQSGALQFQPYFAYALQKRVDASSTSIAMTAEDRAVLNAAYHAVSQMYQGCVSLITSPGRNPQISYTQVVKGCAYLRRYDLVATCVAAGMEAIIGTAAQANKTAATNKVLNLHAQCKLVFDVLILAHSSQDFEELLRVMDSFIAQAYTDAGTFSLMAPVIRKFCPSASLKITTSQSSASSQAVESSRIKLLRFYHSPDVASFNEYWHTLEKTEEQKKHILDWMRSLQGTTRFNTSLHLSVVCEVMGLAGFVEYLQSAEIASDVFDKQLVITNLVHLIPYHPAMVPAVVVAIVRIVLRMPLLCDEVRTTLEAIAVEGTLPLSAAPRDVEYVESRVLLLFLTNPAAYSDQLSGIYMRRSAQVREGLCKFLMNKNKPGLLIKLLLRANDFRQLFKIIVDTYYTAAIALHQVPSIPLIATALSEIRQSLALVNLYDSSAPSATNASLNAFQKELFREESFVVNFAKFLLLLVEQHIDDKMVAYTEPLGSSVEMLVEKVKQLAHGDPVIASYLRLHVRFTAPSVVQFITECTNCNYFSMPYTPTASSKSRPSTFCLDVITSIARAPKYYTVALNYITTLYALVSNTQAQQVLTNSNFLISQLITSPCRYRTDNPLRKGTSPKGLLWIPRADSNNALGHLITEMCRLLLNFGTHLSEILEELILLRLWSGEVVHNPPQPVVVGSNQLLLKDWANSNADLLLKLAEAMKPAHNYGYIVDVITLYTNFTINTFSANIHQALSRPHAALYRKIVVNLTAHWITRGVDMAMVLKVLCHEFHHPNNIFGLFFTEAEADLVIDYIEASEDTKARTRTALICRNNVLPLPINSLLKYPRLLNCINRDFTATDSYAYDSFASLHHATNYIALWVALSKTAQSNIAFEQMNACFRAIVNEFRSRTVQARYRIMLEGVMGQFKQLFDAFPDKYAELKDLKSYAKLMLKSKPAVMKCLAILN